MVTLDIITTTMGFSIGVNKKGEVKGTSLHIGQYARRYENWNFDKAQNRWILSAEFFHFDVENERCYFPKYELTAFIEFLKSQSITANIIDKPGEVGKPAVFYMLPHIEYKNDKQKNAVEYLTDENQGPVRGLALQTGVGKATPWDSKILTPSGWVMMGDITLNHQAVMPDGTAANIIGVYPQGLTKVYRILLEDHRKVESCDEHLWKIFCPDWDDQWKIMTLKEIMSSDKEIYFPICDPDLPNEKLRKLVSVEYVGEKDSQCIMVDHHDSLYITDDYIVTHNTVSYIWAVQKMARRSMTVMTSRLEQWFKELHVYTTLDESDIYLVQGVASLTKLFDQIDKDIKPKFILASTKTIRNYLSYGPTYQHLPPPSEMCKKLGIGIVGTDEFHEHFHTNFVIGTVLNPALFIPITATFNGGSDPFVKKIFDQFVPSKIQFNGGAYEKFVAVTAYQYGGGGYQIKPHNYMSPRGYSQQIFEKFLLKQGRKVLDSLVEDAFIPIIRNHYIDIAEPGEKFLFLCSSTSLCDHLVNVFSRAFPDKKVTAFYSGIPESVTKEYDMILSTPGSAGTGRDIKKLRTCFVFESVSSETRNLQFIGRLRGPPQMLNTPEFIYLSFSCIPQHVKYHQERSMIFGPRALTFQHRRI